MTLIIVALHFTNCQSKYSYILYNLLHAHTHTHTIRWIHMQEYSYYDDEKKLHVKLWLFAWFLFKCVGEIILFHFFLQTFAGNWDQDSVNKYYLKTPFVSLIVRLHPRTWHSRSSLRWELYGCYV